MCRSQNEIIKNQGSSFKIFPSSQKLTDCGKLSVYEAEFCQSCMSFCVQPERRNKAGGGNVRDREHIIFRRLGHYWGNTKPELSFDPTALKLGTLTQVRLEKKTRKFFWRRKDKRRGLVPQFRVTSPQFTSQVETLPFLPPSRFRRLRPAGR